MQFPKISSKTEAVGQGDVRQPGVLPVSVIIPCLDEEDAIGDVVEAVRRNDVAEVIVVDGGSQDRTVEHAQSAGARVIVERRRGYGRAMRAGIAASSPSSGILLFIDGDGSDRRNDPSRARAHSLRTR